jgi:hypothetical protein
MSDSCDRKFCRNEGELFGKKVTDFIIAYHCSGFSLLTLFSVKYILLMQRFGYQMMDFSAQQLGSSPIPACTHNRRI